MISTSTNRNSQKLTKLLLQLWSHINHRRRIQLGILLLLMILASFAEIISIATVMPFLVALTTPERVYEHPIAQPLINFLQLQEPKQLILPITIFFSCIVLITGVFRILLLWIQTRLGHAIGMDFSIDVYQSTLHQPYSVHVSRNSSDVIAGISNKANGLVNGSILPVLNIISSTLILISVLIVLLALEPSIALLTFAGIGFIYSIVIFATKNILARDSHEISRSINQVLKVLHEGLGGIRDILIDGTQDIYCNTYKKADSKLRRAMANVQIVSASPRYAIEALGMVFIAIVAYSLVNKSEGVALVIPLLGTLAIGAQRILPVAQQIYSSLAHIQAGKAPLVDVLNLLEQPTPIQRNRSLHNPIRFQTAITIENLSFRFNSELPYIFKELNLKIAKGSRIGFIGTTGSGKSTLLDIIMGLLSPTHGNLVIDDLPITKQNIRSWQMHIAHVPQSIFLADTSIAENIAFGVPVNDIDLDRVRDCAHKAQISEIIESWDGQYNTFVGERGVRLSGGQRQRIGLARALYKNADVLILDEATSALDSETEQAVMEAIECLGDDLTILMIAHRLTTLRNCDYIVELAKGEIKRIGNYQDMVSNS